MCLCKKLQSMVNMLVWLFVHQLSVQPDVWMCCGCAWREGLDLRTMIWLGLGILSPGEWLVLRGGIEEAYFRFH